MEWHVRCGPVIEWPVDATLPELAERLAASDPSQPFLMDGASGVTVTRGAFLADARRVARGLAALGFHRGDCIFTMMPNATAWCVAAIAAQMLGGTISGINPLSPVAEAARLLSRVPAKAVLAALPFLPVAREAAARQLISTVLVSEEATSEAGAFHSLATIDGPKISNVRRLAFAEDPALFPFSSGTSGAPKAVVITHRNLVAAGAQLEHAFGLSDAARVLGVAPFFHIVGPALLSACLRSGATLVVVPKFDPLLVFDAIARCRVTHIPVVPTMMRAIALHPAAANADFSSVRLAVARWRGSCCVDPENRGCTVGLCRVAGLRDDRNNGGDLDGGTG